MSLLEIMIALSLVTVTIIAFASVFPAGYRLNNANNKQTRATKLANAIAEELRTINVPPNTTPSALKTYISTPFNVGSTSATPDDPFFIVDAADETGIKISPLPLPSNVPTPTPALLANRVTVTVTWKEARNGEWADHHITATSLATNAVKSSKY